VTRPVEVRDDEVVLSLVRRMLIPSMYQNDVTGSNADVYSLFLPSVIMT
jgi:hypothetical protein